MRGLEYIKESCEHQLATTPEDFIGMTLAYMYVSTVMEGRAHRHGNGNNRIVYMNDFPSIICAVRGCVKWVDFRNQPASFANGDITSVNNQSDILRQLKLLVANQDSLTPEEFYFAGLQIHPWADGNGRTFSLLWNYLKGTIDDPVHPPVYKPPIIPVLGQV